jgi:hypothetical protein
MNVGTRVRDVRGEELDGLKEKCDVGQLQR